MSTLCEICGEPIGENGIRVSRLHHVCGEDCKKEWDAAFPGGWGK